MRIFGHGDLVPYLPARGLRLVPALALAGVVACGGGGHASTGSDGGGSGSGAGNGDGAPDGSARPGACRSFARPAPPPAPPRDDGLAPLASVPVPAPEGGDIVDHDAAVRLGKAFFWDVQAGSDGRTACASCHYHAGADARLMNTISPGPDETFDYPGVTGPGQMATLTNIGSDDRVGSQGVASRAFDGLDPDPSAAADRCTPTDHPIFGALGQVTPRNAPTVIGAVFYRDLFWDGRANHVFNGADPFGPSSSGAGSLALDNSAAASQAVGPPVEGSEMSCTGRTFAGPSGLGAKLLLRAPLAHQTVAPGDSALGCMSAWPDPGLTCDGGPCSYRDLIAAAFGPDLAADAQDQFARIWGQALWAYESTLIPDDTPLDRYLAGDESALTADQKSGLDVFEAVGCINCHAGPELSDATVDFAAANGLINPDGGDQGFHNTGVRPTSINFSEDLGRAGQSPDGVPFSESGAGVDRGAFKTPGLRNVGLTAPYFHNGGKATLEAVVEFYAEGGDYRNPSSQLRAFVLLPTTEAELIDFLQHGLTDCRVATEKAPFDHPSLDVPDGPSLSAVGADGDGGDCP